jgi:hypothetical protein
LKSVRRGERERWPAVVTTFGASRGFTLLPKRPPRAALVLAIAKTYPASSPTRAMQLFMTAIEKLNKDGMEVDVLKQINGAEVAAAAAERFDRSVNPGKYQPRARLFGLNRS